MADNSLATLAREDVAGSMKYAVCQSRHLAGVAAYEAVRMTIIKFNEGK